MTMESPKPIIERVVVTYSQEEDTSGRSGIEHQHIELEMVRVDEGDEGFYTVIKTDRWALNDPEELKTLLEDFTKRCKAL